MNYLVTESQLKVIVNEQRSDYAVDRQSNAIMTASGIRSKEDYNTVNSLTNKAMEGATIPLDDLVASNLGNAESSQCLQSSSSHFEKSLRVLMT